MAYRFASPSQVFFNLAGTAPIPSGRWTFYQPSSTTTPKTTYSDPQGSIANPNPVLLDLTARLSAPVFLEGGYFAELRDAGSNLVWNGEITSGVAESLAIPPLAPGFLTNNGSVLSWGDIDLLPDQTGSDDYILSTDGINALWIPQPVIPAPPAPNTTISAGSFKQGGGANNFVLQQWGTGTAPAAPSVKQTSLAVVFPTAYTTAPDVQVTPRGGPFAPGGANGGYYADFSLTTPPSLTGFTVTFNTDHGEANSDGNITSPITFGWHSIGQTTS